MWTHLIIHPNCGLYLARDLKHYGREGVIEAEYQYLGGSDIGANILPDNDPLTGHFPADSRVVKL